MDSEQIADEVAQRVRELVADAQKRADEIVSGAEEEAERIRREAEADARDRLDQVREAIDELQGRLGSTKSEVEPGPVTVPEPAPPATPEPTPDPVPEPTPSPGEPVPAPEPVPEPTPPPDEADRPEAVSASAGANGADDSSAARLIAMKLALDGASKDEAREQLGSEYEVADLDGLLDDVYAKAGK